MQEASLHTALLFTEKCEPGYRWILLEMTFSFCPIALTTALLHNWSERNTMLFGVEQLSDVWIPTLLLDLCQ